MRKRTKKLAALAVLYAAYVHIRRGQGSYPADTGEATQFLGPDNEPIKTIHREPGSDFTFVNTKGPDGRWTRSVERYAY